MNHPIVNWVWFNPTKNDERTADKRFLREIMFTSNHIHIVRLSIRVDIVNYFCLDTFFFFEILWFFRSFFSRQISQFDVQIDYTGNAYILALTMMMFYWLEFDSETRKSSIFLMFILIFCQDDLNTLSLFRGVFLDSIFFKTLQQFVDKSQFDR